MNVTQKLLAEFVGTFTLIFVRVSAICNDVGLVGIAIALGLAIAVMVSAKGHISGGHFNPAVSLGALAGGLFVVMRHAQRQRKKVLTSNFVHCLTK